LKALLDAGADVESPNREGQTALMTVARTSRVDAAEVLLAHGARIDAREQWRGQTALMWAAAQSQPEMVRFLVAHGADVNARSTVNITANAMFTTAAPVDWPSNVSAEPRAGYRAPGGLTPLLYAAREGCVDCVKALVEGKANVDLQDPEGVTPLIMAITNMHFDAAAILIKAGANLNKWDLWGGRPL